MWGHFINVQVELYGMDKHSSLPLPYQMVKLLHTFITEADSVEL
jgi:hypothetical protein